MTRYLRLLVCGFALQCSALPASANWLYTPGAGPSAFRSFNSGTTPAGTSACAAANTDCLANVPIDLTGSPLFVTGNAGLVTGTGGTFPVTGTVTANAGTNLNTSLLALETGGNLATLTTDFGAPGATACTTDTASCNLNQQMQRNNQRLTTINTTLGTPFQAGGSIGNTSFAATQATAASLNATVVGTGTFVTQSTLAAETTKVIGTVRNLGNAGAITDFAGQNAASPANAWLMGCQFNTSPTTITTGNASPCQLDNAGNMKVNIVAGAGSGGTAIADGATFTIGTTSETPAACTFVTGGITITTGKSSILQCTAAGSLHTTVDNTNVNGSAVSMNSSPVVIASDQAAVATKFASQYPTGATAITASATGTTGATTATLAGTSGKTTYICGYSIRANASAAATVTNTVTGVITATLSSTMWVAPNASGLGIDEQIFSPCVPANSTNVGIAIVSGAPGTGGVVSSKGWGYQL